MDIPIFPLNGAILFPRTNLPLNIFEKRYLKMVDFSLANNRLIGMIQTDKNGDFFHIGCYGKITNFNEADDGRYHINLEGISRFKIKEIKKNRNEFILANVENLNDKENFAGKDLSFNQKLIVKFKNYLKAKKIKINTSDFESLNALNLAKIICVICPLDYLTKQMLLESNDSKDFCESLISVLDIETNNMGENTKIN